DRDAAQREAEAAKARLVEPLQVVDEQRDRRGLAELLQHTSDGQGHRQGVDLASSGFGMLQSNRQRAPLRTRKTAVRSRRTLADQFGQSREGQSSLELCRSNRKHISPLALRQLG